MYAILTADERVDRAKLDAELDAPLAEELTPEERRRQEIRRIADANRAAVAALGRTEGMRTP